MRRRALGKTLGIKGGEHIAMAAAGVVQSVSKVKTLGQGIASALQGVAVLYLQVGHFQ